MEIPKHIDNILTKRRIAAEDLSAYDTELTNWMEEQGMNCMDSEIVDSVRTGAIEICEPSSAEHAVRDYIKNFRK